MRRIIRVGKPTHYRPSQDNITACGLVGTEYDPRDVDCINCRKTAAYQRVMDGCSKIQLIEIYGTTTRKNADALCVPDAAPQQTSVTTVG